MGIVSHVTRVYLLALAVGLLGPSRITAQETTEPPPNTPALVEWDAGQGRLSLAYHDAVIFSATVTAKDADGQSVAVIFDSKVDTTDEKVEQTLTFTPVAANGNTTLVLTGTVVGSEEAFSAETLSEAQQRFPYIRNSVGPSHNRRNNAVYDRRWDWVLLGPTDGGTHLMPTRQENRRQTFSWMSRGASIELVFRPRFYQKHKGIKHFTPWTYKTWEGSLTGYCTWWAYKAGFTQQTLDAMLDVFTEKNLPEFGYHYMQFDNCYQHGNGSAPHNWLNWNSRYPGGWKYAMKAIREAGMKPGIWVHRVHRPTDPGVREIVDKHPEWFIPGEDGEPYYSSGFVGLNTGNKEAVEAMIRPLYRGLKDQGWDYVKIDGSGDLMNSYNRRAEFFEKTGATPEETFRVWDRVAREELGPDVFILSCWGVHPSLNVVGLVDGCRLWRDGFGTAEFQRFNSWNGVVWRNDPDHCDVLGDYLMDTDAMMPVFGSEDVPVRSVIRPALCSLAGGVLMVSDKVEVYQDDRNLEGMKRSAPVLFTVPGQLYDYTPRRPGQFSMPHGGDEASWWLLEIDRPFDHWSVLARFQWGENTDRHDRELRGVPEQEIHFADLGLAADREYLVFEFWSQTFLGKSKGSFTAPAMDENTGLYVFAIREVREHPWVLSTTRHVSQGGVSLLDESWDSRDNVLSGKSEVIVGDPYVMTVHLPPGFRIEDVEFGDEEFELADLKEIAAVRIVPTATKTARWKIRFAK